MFPLVHVNMIQQLCNHNYYLNNNNIIITIMYTIGSFYTSGDELMIAVTGKPLDPQIYLSYLRLKYSEIYKL